jgi:hypothetical protein
MTYQAKSEESTDEWDSCIAQINKFDEYLVKLREYGFTLITGIITAAGFLGTKEESAIIQVGVALVIGVLIWILWRLDQYYQDLLFGAVVRGEFLEKESDRGLIHSMATYAWRTNRQRSSKLFIIYMGFLVSIFIVGFIFLWNATEAGMTVENLGGNSASATSIFSTQTVQTPPATTSATKRINGGAT